VVEPFSESSCSFFNFLMTGSSADTKGKNKTNQKNH
jgi:hypothetical protein